MLDHSTAFPEDPEKHHMSFRRLITVYGLAMIIGLAAGIIWGSRPENKTIDENTRQQETPNEHRQYSIALQWSESHNGDLTVESVVQVPVTSKIVSIEIWVYGLTQSGHRIGAIPLSICVQQGWTVNRAQTQSKDIIGRNLTHTPIEKLFISSISVSDGHHITNLSGLALLSVAKQSKSVEICPDVPIDL